MKLLVVSCNAQALNQIYLLVFLGAICLFFLSVKRGSIKHLFKIGLLMKMAMRRKMQSALAIYIWYDSNRSRDVLNWLKSIFLW